MKKILFLFIALALCFSMSIPACADFTEDGLTVTIPDSINLSGTTHSKAIGISGSLPVNKIADITVSSENSFLMKNDLNTDSVLRYSVSVAGKEIKSGDSVLTANSAEASNRKTATLNFNILDTPKTAGTYKDTLTFTLSLKDNPLARIEITTLPTKTEYTAGESFDPNGMIVTAYYADGSSQPVSDYIISDDTELSVGKSSVTVSYTENSISKTAVVPITVNSAVPLLKSGSGWYRGSLTRADITSVTFADSYTPTGGEDESWDASDKNNGSVMGYRNGTDIIIAGNGSGYIKANAYCGSMFNSFSALAEINNLALVDTSASTNMAYMFAYCYKLRSLDVSSFNMSNVKSILYMFLGCYELESIDVSRWDTSNIENMQEVFCSCKKLKELDVSRWNTSNATNMLGLFADCTVLPSVDVSNFDTRKVTTMRRMFMCCPALENVDIHNFKTDNVTDMSEMFIADVKLKTIDMTGANTANVTKMDSMFSNCQTLEAIYVGDGFSTASVQSSDRMFLYDYALKGAIPYEVGKDDAAYANYTTGYLTFKAA